LDGEKKYREMEHDPYIEKGIQWGKGLALYKSHETE